MKELYAVADKFENALLGLKEPEWVLGYIVQFDIEGRNEGVILNVTKVNEQQNQWELFLRKLLGSEIPASEKKDIFIKIEEKIKSLETKFSQDELRRVILNTKLGAGIASYESGCKNYEKIVNALITVYKDTFFENYNSLEIPKSTGKNNLGIFKKKKHEPDLLLSIRPDNIKYFEIICEALTKIGLLSKNSIKLPNPSVTGHETIANKSNEKRANKSIGELNQTGMNEDVFYRWDIEKQGNILKFVAFSVALTNKRIVFGMESGSHRFRAFAEYFHVTKDCSKQFEDTQKQKSQKYVPYFEKIIDNAIKGNEVKK